ncbi:hypothetical protein V2H77_11690 [Photorhabdus sp. P32]|uniref:hypothetical protein n=1 Tax=Photorhabdus sp. P32 TaxID=3117549 RepID=UPI00311B1BD3
MALRYVISRFFNYLRNIDFNIYEVIMLKIYCDSFKVNYSNRANEIEMAGNITIQGNYEEVLNSTSLSFSEIKEYFENRGYKIEAL